MANKTLFSAINARTSFQNKFNPIQLWEAMRREANLQTSNRKISLFELFNVILIKRLKPRSPSSKASTGYPCRHHLLWSGCRCTCTIRFLPGKVIYRKIVKTEKGFVSQSIICDGRLGLLQDLFNTPTQMAGKALKVITRTHKNSHKNDFYV
ncbi:hypothetical protein SC936_06030 [Aggregatibacter actinomycetemcomitans serotype e str. SC936]|nr:hypothetical protein SC936_06030 [Aggregatibacter actinomycetemcomitans serotype e str. SC936]